MTENQLSESAIHQRLTAYLDGELGDDDHADVEQRLLNDPQYRKAMQKMQKTWDLLDLLPTSRVDNSFTQSTLEMVISETEKELLKRKQSPWKWPLRFGALLGVLLFGLGASFGIAQWIKDAPDRDLRDNIHVIENLTHLENAGSIEFLKMLGEKKVFDEDVHELPELERLSQRWTQWGDSKKAGERHRAVEKYLDSTSSDLIARLKTNRSSFDQMTSQQQQKLRDMYLKIQSHPDRESLLESLELYNRWLTTLAEHRKNSLLAADSVEKRLESITNMRGAKAFAKLGDSRLPESDYAAFRGWLDRMLDDPGSRINIPPFYYQLDVIDNPVANALTPDNELNLEDRFRKYGQMLLAIREANPNQTLSWLYGGNAESSHLVQLKRLLSKEALATISQQALHEPGGRKPVDGKPPTATNDQEVEFVFKWIKAVLEDEFQPMAIQLRKFFNEHLSEFEQKELDRFPKEERTKKLQQQYQEFTRRNDQPGR